MGNERVKELESLLREAHNALGLWKGLIIKATIKNGICMCGEPIEFHEHSIYAGHVACDSGEYYAKIAEEITNDLIPQIEHALNML